MLTLSQAEKITRRALEVARANKLAPMAVAVFNAKGQLINFAMEDGNPLLREKIAMAKARGALGLGMDSDKMAGGFTARPGFFGAAFTVAEGQLVPVAGGILVRDPKTNEIIGAVGVSGDLSEKDEWCAVEGVKTAGLSCTALTEKREPFLKAHL